MQARFCSLRSCQETGLNSKALPRSSPGKKMTSGTDKEADISKLRLTDERHFHAPPSLPMHAFHLLSLATCRVWYLILSTAFLTAKVEFSTPQNRYRPASWALQDSLNIPIVGPQLIVESADVAWIAPLRCLNKLQALLRNPT